MKLQCSLGHEIGADDPECPTCGEELTALAVFVRSFAWLKRGPLVACTGFDCKRVFPLSYEECPFCEKKNNPRNAVNAVVVPLQERGQKFINSATPHRRLTIQKLYFVVSAFFLLTAFVRVCEGDNWGGAPILAAVYLGSVLILVRWFLPRKIIRVVLARTTWIVKLALVFNYFTGLLFLQVAIEAWWEHFAALALLVATTWGGAWLFCNLLWPMSVELNGHFLGEENSRDFDPMGGQGRGGIWDR